MIQETCLPTKDPFLTLVAETRFDSLWALHPDAMPNECSGKRWRSSALYVVTPPTRVNAERITMKLWSAIAAKIIAGDGNFVIGVKGNQPTLHDTIESFFDDHWKDGDWFRGRCHRFQTIEQQGACQTERYYDVAPIPKRDEVFADWPSVQAIGMVINVRRRGDEVTEEVRYYILSEYLSGEQFATTARQHWSIENNCHWQLDVLFNEDASRVRERTLANNLSWLRRVAVSLLKHHTCKDSVKGKQQRAAWNHHFLAKVLIFN